LDNLEKYRSVNLTSIPGKVVERKTLESVSKHVKDKKVIRSGQQRYMEGKTCLTDLRAFHNEMTGLVDEWMWFVLTLVRLSILSPLTSL